MKKNFYKINLIAVSIFAISGGAFAQTVSTFENLTLAPNTHNDSIDPGFASGNASFHSTYNTSWGYWDSGFAYSNEGDTAVSPSDYSTQLFQTKAGTGNYGSANFAVGQQGAKISFINSASGALGVYITNTTYAYNSMALGDSFAKKFGDSVSSPHSAPGVNNGYPDWFMLTIKGYKNNLPTIDSVNFYLADFRFANNSQDYIVKDWQYVDLSAIGLVDSLAFILTSSDVGTFGINTPTYFCIDDFKTKDVSTGITAINNAPDFAVYPNPVMNDLTVHFNNNNQRVVNVYNALGALVQSFEVNSENAALSFDTFNSGIYFVNVNDGNKSSTIKVIKK